jgi:nucleotide-binding universal stress UspA family protein
MHHPHDIAAAEQAVTAARYAALAVHVEPGLSSSGHVEVAGRLARELDAFLIGIGAEALDAAFSSDPFSGLVMAEWVTAAAEQVERNLRTAEEVFERDAAGARLEWRTLRTFPDRALAQVARAVDLIIMPPIREGASPGFADRNGEVVLSAGRPVLVTPHHARHLHGKTVVVAWKDTREARRAVMDAMPFLTRAEEVLVHAVAPAADEAMARTQVNDVVAFLKRHGVTARGDFAVAKDEEVSAEIDRVAELSGADLIVAGGYGRSRLGEWIFGGVTHEFLHRPGRFILLSH